MATERFTLKDVRIAFAPGLFRSTDYQGDGKFKYKVKFILAPNHPQFKPLESLFQKLAKEEWKDKGPAVLKGLQNNSQKYCFIDGDNYSETEGMPGNFVLAASNRVRPTAMASDGVTQVTEDDGVIFSGCRVNALLEFRTMSDNKHGKGLFCTVRGVQHYKDADAFSGGPPPADMSEFANLSTESEDDPTA
jgi:Protein of unknown function (DUF2815)